MINWQYEVTRNAHCRPNIGYLCITILGAIVNSRKLWVDKIIDRLTYIKYYDKANILRVLYYIKEGGIPYKNSSVFLLFKSIIGKILVFL